jgi:2-oxoglutarate dehydrogenase E2 component (dihydrolipoamide succinyltransferase)
MLEVPAIADGVLGQILKKEGDTVSSGDVLALLEEGAGASAAKPKAAEAPAAAPKTAVAPAPAVSAAATSGPEARKMMAEQNIPAGAIQGSGKGGRVTKADVIEFGQKPVAAAADMPAVAGGRVEQRVPMTRIRARIAERLVEAQHTAAILTTFNEVDLHAVSQIRKDYKDSFEKQHGVKLGFMSFFVKASIEALKRYPVVNASVDGNDIVYHAYYDIGIAVSSPRGLVVPILRDVDQLGFADVEKKISEFGAKARDGKLTLEELQGGTFSITNGGVFGSMLSTPILNPPQSAILGMHGITERPMVVDGEIKIRPMMYLALSYDHRIIDGREAVLCLRTIKECLEDPARLLLQI